MISDALYEVIAGNTKTLGAFGMGYTYGAHPVSAAVALETLRIYEERDIVSHVRQVSTSFQSRLQNLSQHPLVGQARGIGLIGAVELVANKETKDQFNPSVKAAQVVAERAQANGLIVRGLTGDAVAICPPLIIEKKQIEDLFDRFERALEEAAPAIRGKAA
jgi:4-aminobutyrate--pyruvate transaminase